MKYKAHKYKLKGVADKNLRKYYLQRHKVVFPTYPVSAKIVCFVFCRRTANVLTGGRQSTFKRKGPNECNIDGLRITNNGILSKNHECVGRWSSKHIQKKGLYE